MTCNNQGIVRITEKILDSEAGFAGIPHNVWMLRLGGAYHNIQKGP